ncbi:MAG: YdeI/OmpD-associated family protein [Burkholderiales bacterium]
MATTDPRIDAYIEGAAPFARPILAQLRAAVHAACPEAQETIKWRMPFFVYGDHILGHMAAFKQHCSFGLWKGRGVAAAQGRDGEMGQFGRLATLKDLPPKRDLLKTLRDAVAQIDAGAKAPGAAKGRNTKAPPEVPAPLAAALQRNEAARTSFAAFSSSQRLEYIEWIAEAKRAETVASRVAQAIEWLGEGKSRNWKYRAR